jgi:hypothetical protein
MAGEGGLADAAKARGLFEKACQGGFLRACESLGGAWLRGEGGPVDAIQARAWLKKACDGDLGPSCVALEVMNGKGLGGPVDPAIRAALIQKICERGPAWACPPEVTECTALLPEWCSRTLGRKAPTPRDAASCRPRCEELAKAHALRPGLSIEQCASELCE